MMQRRYAIVVGLLLTLLNALPVQAQVPQPVPLPPPVPAPGPAPVPAPVPTPTPSIPTDRSVVGPPTVSFATFQSVLRQAQSPMVAEAQAVYDMGMAASIDPAFVLAIARKESVFGTVPNWVGRKPDGATTYNWGNIRCGSYPRCYNGWREYTSWTEAAQDWYRLLSDAYIAHGLTTVQQIIPVYAPSIENDTAGYIQQVLAWMQQWSMGQVQPAPPSDPGLFNIDAWTSAPINASNLDILRQLTLIAWQQNLAGLRVTETLATASDTITPALGPILDRLGRILAQFGHAVIVLGVAIAGLGLLLAPMLVKQQLVSLRSVPVLLLILLLIFPVAGAMFVGGERFRRSLGDHLYTALFSAADTALRPDQPPSPGRGLGDLPPLFDGRTERHAVDVAAAYLMVDRADLAREDDLPARFTETFFPQTSDEIRRLGPDVRQDALSRATRGFGRMSSGLALTALGHVEEAIHVALVFGLLVLSVALLFALVVAVFSPILRLVDALASYLLQLFIWSAVISVIQAVGMAFLFREAAIGTPGQIFGLAVVLVLLNGVLLIGTIVIVGMACWRGAHTIGRFTPIAGTVTLADKLQAYVARRSPSSSVRPSPPVPGPRLGLRHMLLNYGAVRGLGASPQAAFAYAIAPAPYIQRAGAVALALGKLPADVERALVIGSTRMFGAPGSLRSLVAARHAFHPAPPPQPRRRHHPRPTPRPYAPPTHRRPRHYARHAGAVVHNARRRRRCNQGAVI